MYASTIFVAFLSLTQFVCVNAEFGNRNHLRHLESGDSADSADSGSSRSAIIKSTTIDFMVKAKGEQEIPSVSTHTKANLKLSFDKGFTKALFWLDVYDGKAITQVHLHCGLAGENGPVLATLYKVAPVPGPGGKDIHGRASKGALKNADISVKTCGDTHVNNIASLYEAILSRRVYVNVHSEKNPSGEVRGQIFH